MPAAHARRDGQSAACRSHNGVRTLLRSHMILERQAHAKHCSAPMNMEAVKSAATTFSTSSSVLRLLPTAQKAVPAGHKGVATVFATRMKDDVRQHIACIQHFTVAYQTRRP
jgi:hypothetical protein